MNRLERRFAEWNRQVRIAERWMRHHHHIELRDGAWRCVAPGCPGL